jgi:hypothetical protein
VTNSFLHAPETESFRLAAMEFCALLDRHQEFTAPKLLTAVEPLLARLYHAAALLPDPEPTSEHIPDDAVSVDDVRSLQHSLGGLLRAHDEYWELFDPVDAADRSPVAGLLSNDLVEIYLDVWNSLGLLDPRREIPSADVLWEWRFSFSSHWGRHAASALRVVNSLVHTHFVQALYESPDA